MEYFKFLPVEITSDILSRVPIEIVLDCKLVCTNWRNLVSSHHPSFSKLHLYNHPSAAADSGKLAFIALTHRANYLYYFEFNEKHDHSASPIHRIRRFSFKVPISDSWIIGSCNGLICLAGGHNSVWICNPITKQHVVLPQINTDSDMHYSYGFGFVSSTNEYKVVRLPFLWTEFLQVDIYTLGSGNGWRNLGRFNNRSGDYWPRSIFASEAIYWMGFSSEMIAIFDLPEEKFYDHLAPPPLPLDISWCNHRIGVLDGSLFLAVWQEVEGVDNFDIWVLKKKNDNDNMKEEREQHRWSREFRIDISELVAITKTAGALTYGGKYLNIYDPKTSTSKRLVDFKEHIRQVCRHKNTLVSLKELGENDTEIMESVGVEDTGSYDQPLKLL